MDTTQPPADHSIVSPRGSSMARRLLRYMLMTNTPEEPLDKDILPLVGCWPLNQHVRTQTRELLAILGMDMKIDGTRYTAQPRAGENEIMEELRADLLSKTGMAQPTSTLLLPTAAPIEDLDTMRGAYILVRMYLCRNGFVVDEHEMVEGLSVVDFVNNPILFPAEGTIQNTSIAREQWTAMIRYFSKVRLLTRQRPVPSIQSSSTAQHSDFRISCPPRCKGQQELPEEAVMRLVATGGQLGGIPDEEDLGRLHRRWKELVELGGL